MQRKLLELENDCRAKERDYDGQLCEAQQHAKKQKDDLRSLSVKLKSLEEEFAEVKMKLSASEGRVTGLENEIVKIESRLNVFFVLFWESGGACCLMPSFFKTLVLRTI